MVVAIYLNIHNIYTVQSKCKNFIFLMAQNHGPGLVLGAQLSCCSAKK